jgi:hypothetical protein
MSLHIVLCYYDAGGFLTCYVFELKFDNIPIAATTSPFGYYFCHIRDKIIIFA